MLRKEHLKLLVCPTCRSNLSTIENRNMVSGFYCQRCRVVHPVKDGIPIILAEQARNFKLEYPLIREIQKKLPIDSPYELREAVQKTLNLLKSKKGSITWEWEDEEFWSREYTKEMVARVPKNYNIRIWQREFLVRELASQTSLRGKTILEVGSGEGQNFELLFSKYCDENSLYIATDISLKGLKLNRSRNKRENSLYVLCSEDYELPFRNNLADVLCYFGILHHTKNKSNNILKDIRLVKSNGYVIVVEPLNRPQLPVASRILSRIETSAHEERISKKNLLFQFARNQMFDLICTRQEGTPLLYGMANCFPVPMVKHRRFFLFVLGMDILISKIAGHIVPFLGAGEIFVLARRDS